MLLSLSRGTFGNGLILMSDGLLGFSDLGDRSSIKSAWRGVVLGWSVGLLHLLARGEDFAVQGTNGCALGTHALSQGSWSILDLGAFTSHLLLTLGNSRYLTRAELLADMFLCFSRRSALDRPSFASDLLLLLGDLGDGVRVECGRHFGG